MADPFLSLSSYATTLFVSAIDRYGLAVTTWTPETIEMELVDDVRGTIPLDNLAKLFVAIRLRTSDEFFNSPAAFCAVCVTLSGHPPSDGRLSFPDATDVAWAVTEAMLIAHPEEDKPFSPDIAALIGQILDQEGMLIPPDVLRIAVREKDLAAQVNYEFSDDPEMFRAIFDRDRGRADDINNLVAGRSRGLFAQLAALDLRTVDGDRVRKLAKKMAAVLPPADPIGLTPN